MGGVAGQRRVLQEIVSSRLLCSKLCRPQLHLLLCHGVEISQQSRTFSSIISTQSSPTAAHDQVVQSKILYSKLLTIKANGPLPKHQHHIRGPQKIEGDILTSVFRES